jgi:hypothetical protein
VARETATTIGGAAPRANAKPPLTQKPMEDKSMVPELILHIAAPLSVAKVLPSRSFPVRVKPSWARLATVPAARPAGAQLWPFFQRLVFLVSALGAAPEPAKAAAATAPA